MHRPPGGALTHVIVLRRCIRARIVYVHAMRNAPVAILTSLALAACGGKAPPPTSTTAPGDVPAQGPDAPGAVMTSDECTAAGGQIKGDIGDGQVACDPGDRQLGRVQLGIEGSICCARPSP